MTTDVCSPQTSAPSSEAVPSPDPSRPLLGHTAVVTGASRGAGKGIALALGSAGATVYVLARTSRKHPRKDDIPGTIEDTAEAVTARGGRGIARACDCSDQWQLEAAINRIGAECGHIDLLVNCAWAGNELAIDLKPFWEQSAGHWTNMFDQGVKAYLLASAAVVPWMLPRQNGLIVNISFWDRDKYTGQFFYDLAKNAMNRMAFTTATELKPHHITVLALSPGFMRTERVLRAFKNDPTLTETHGVPTETPEYVGRSVAALASDKDVIRHSGKTLCVGDLAKEYGFTDVDGTQPEPFRLPLALLGIAQREIKAKRTPDTSITQRRKAMPKEVKTLGDQLKKARMEKGLSQRQVSAITGIPRNRLQGIERDERVPSPEDWKRLTNAMGK